MTHEWMIDVLADLRQYAIRHYYMGLAEQLDDAIVVAAVELRGRDSDDAATTVESDSAEPPRPTLVALDGAGAT